MEIRYNFKVECHKVFLSWKQEQAVIGSKEEGGALTDLVRGLNLKVLGCITDGFPISL